MVLRSRMISKSSLEAKRTSRENPILLARFNEGDEPESSEEFRNRFSEWFTLFAIPLIRDFVLFFEKVQEHVRQIMLARYLPQFLQ